MRAGRVVGLRLSPFLQITVLRVLFVCLFGFVSACFPRNLFSCASFLCFGTCLCSLVACLFTALCAFSVAFVVVFCSVSGSTLMCVACVRVVQVAVAVCAVRGVCGGQALGRRYALVSSAFLSVFFLFFPPVSTLYHVDDTATRFICMVVNTLCC